MIAIDDERLMDARPATLLIRLLMVCEDLRYAWREDRLKDFYEDVIRENEPSIAQKADSPAVAFVLPARRSPN